MKLFLFLIGIYWMCMGGAVIAGFKPTTLTVVVACISTGVSFILDALR